MRGIDDNDEIEGRKIEIESEKKELKRWIMFLRKGEIERRRNLRRKIERKDEDGKKFRILRKVREDKKIRIRRREGWIEEDGKEIFRIGDGGNEIKDMMCRWKEY